MQQQPGILSGLLVVEVATYIAAPAAATLLADFGAQVIKLERPPHGDPFRYLYQNPPLPPSEINYPFLVDGRNKQSVTLNIAKAKGREALQKLVAQADIYITNYQPDVNEKLQLRYEDLAPLNPRLIYAHLTGYGESGPDAARPGYDMTAYWARSGLMESLHDADGGPSISVCGQGDHPSAMSVFAGILLALYDRQRTGLGTKVSSSLLANGVWSNSSMVQAALCGAPPHEHSRRAAARNVMINHYLSRDGKRFLLCAIQPAQDWPRLCSAWGREDLIGDPRFGTADARLQNRAELVGIADSIFATRDMAEWAEILDAHSVAWGPVNRTIDAPDDPQMAAAGLFREMDHPRHGRLRVVNPPIELASATKAAMQPAPEVGQHTAEVLRALGYDESEIQEISNA